MIERFASGMAKAGVRCDTRIYDGQGHGFFNKEPWKTLTLIEADRFLASLGWLDGEPTLPVPPTNPSATSPSSSGREATGKE